MSTTTDANRLAGLAGAWRLDPRRTTVGFRARSALVIRAKGTLQATQGALSIGADGSVSGRLVLDPASITSRIKKRDAHLRSADFFHAEAYPEIVFTATGLKPAGSADHFTLTGDLTVRGESTPVTLDVELTARGDSLTVAGEAVITKQHLRMMKQAAAAKSRVAVSAHFEREPR